MIAGRPVGGQELLLLRPERAGAHEHVGRAGAGAVIGRPEHDGVPGERGGGAERRSGRGQDLLLQGPGGARPHEHVGRAAAGDHGRVPGDRRRAAEEISRRAVGGEDLLLLAPRGARADENVGRARIRARGGVVPGRPHHGRVPRDRYRAAQEVVGRSALRGQDLLLLAPGRSRAHEHVRRARVHRGRDVVAGRPRHHRVPGNRHRLAEEVARGRVGGHELRLLGPGRPGAHEDVARARVPCAGKVVRG